MRARLPDAAPVSTTMAHGANWKMSVGPYRVYDAPDSDQLDGPTHQPGAVPGSSHEPLRTPFGVVGVPGAGHERDVVDLDLTKNRHAAGIAPVVAK